MPLGSLWWSFFLGELSFGAQGGLQKPVDRGEGPTWRFRGQFRYSFRDSLCSLQTSVEQKERKTCLIVVYKTNLRQPSVLHIMLQYTRNDFCDFGF